MWSGPLMVAAVLSLVAGVTKIRAPEGAAAALDAVDLRVGRPLVRLGAALEAALAATVIVTGWLWAGALLAATFASFAVFVAVARQRPGVTSCGCFGGQGERPTLRHVVVNAALAVLVALATAAGPSGLPSVLAHQPLAGVPFVALTLGTAWLTFLALGNERVSRHSPTAAEAAP